MLAILLVDGALVKTGDDAGNDILNNGSASML